MAPFRVKVSLLAFPILFFGSVFAVPMAWPVKVSQNQRYFVDQGGKPVFWLGTTQWELFRGYKLEDAKTILEKTKAQGFTFAQVMLMGVGDGTGRMSTATSPGSTTIPSPPTRRISRTSMPF